MQDSQPLIQQVAQEIAALNKDSSIEAGQLNNKKQLASDEHIDAINQVFTLFSLNYHNQYYSAYSQISLESQAKRLWSQSLLEFSPEQILQGAKKVITESDYLPTLNRMIRACQPSPEEIGLPDAHSAYVEACRAPNPKAAYRWSHPAVYHAGVACDWYFLQSSSEKIAFPIYEKHYLKLCERVLHGESLNAPNAPALNETIETPLSTEENIKRMEELRKKLDI